MSRGKKKRSNLMTVLERKPKKQEFLADPNSKESRRKKAIADKKKPKSVYEKTLNEAQAKKEAENQKAPAQNGRLAAKIKAMHAEKKTADE